MSESFFSTYGADTTTETSGNNGGSDTEGVVPNSVSDGYESLGDLQADIGRALNAHPSDEVGVPGKDDNGDRNPEGVMEVWWVAVHEAKGLAGAAQRDENEFSMGDYREAFGRTLATIQHEDLTGGEKAEFKDAGIDLDEVETPRRIPTCAKGRLPVFVTDEDELNEALQLLDYFLSEEVGIETETETDTTEGGETASDDGEDTSEAGEPENGAEAIRAVLTEDADLGAAAAQSRSGYRQAVVEAVEERHGFAVSKNSVTKAKGDLNLAEIHAGSDHSGEGGADPTNVVGEDDDESEESEATDGGLSDDDIEKVATVVATAVTEALNN